MNTKLYREGNISYALTDDFFTEKELSCVKKELQDVDRFLVAPKETNTAYAANGKPLKEGRGVFLDDIYTGNRAASDILTACRKLFSDEYIRKLAEFDLAFALIAESDSDHTLLNRYTSGGHYRTHRDDALISTVIMLGWEAFSGGDFVLGNKLIPFKNNRAITFLGLTPHGCTPIEGEGVRYSLAVFMDRLMDRQTRLHN